MAIQMIQVQHLVDSDQFANWKEDVIQVKQLFSERRYKRCAIVCEGLRHHEDHSIRESFLCFFQAICYESMGATTHPYSSNKIPLLQLAKDSFTHALDALSPPSKTKDDRLQYGRDLSSEGTVSTYQGSSQGLFTPESTRYSKNSRTDNFPASTSSSNYSSGPISEHSPDIASYYLLSPRRNYQFATTPSPMVLPRSRKQQGNHRDRLSMSLSLEHVVVDELIPSPLFKNNANPEPIETPVEEEKDSSPPLPALPFNHKATFQKKGNRYVLVTDDSHKSKISTTTTTKLSLTNTTNDMPHKDDGTMTPLTPRYRKISEIFSPVPYNENLATYLTSVTLHNFEQTLLSFRTQIETHISGMDTRIKDARQVQEQHKAEREQNTRMASFWSFRPSDLASSSSRQQQQPKNKSNNMNVSPLVVAKKERIARLKADGWNVTKERHGWKGQDYYDALRYRTEVELV